MTEAETYSIWLEAASEPEAIQLAEENWRDNGFTDWRFEDAEAGPFDVIDQREVAP
ncbi:MAG TPA: hypothetical protein PLF37_15720 [Planctomycetota bacterium]|nr:hypothetical protein [Planctomycetota bacterium]